MPLRVRSLSERERVGTLSLSFSLVIIQQKQKVIQMDAFCKKHKHFEEKIHQELLKIARDSKKRILLANVSKFKEYAYNGSYNKTKQSIISTMPNSRGLSKYTNRVQKQIFESLDKFNSFNYLVTPTVDSKQFCCPIGAWQWISSAWNRLRGWFARKVPEFSYFGTFEATKRGYPHIHVLCASRYLTRAELAKLRTIWGFRIQYDKIRDSYSTALCYTLKYVIKSLQQPSFVALLRALHHRQYIYSRGLLRPLSKVGKSEDIWEYVHTLPVEIIDEILKEGLSLIAVKKDGVSSIPPKCKKYIAEHKEWILYKGDEKYA